MLNGVVKGKTITYSYLVLKTLWLVVFKSTFIKFCNGRRLNMKKIISIYDTKYKKQYQLLRSLLEIILYMYVSVMLEAVKSHRNHHYLLQRSQMIASELVPQQSRYDWIAFIWLFGLAYVDKLHPPDAEYSLIEVFNCGLYNMCQNKVEDNICSLWLVSYK